MRFITTFFVVLVGAAFLSLSPVANGKDAVQWLEGSKGFEAATEKAGSEKKFLLLDFFHPH